MGEWNNSGDQQREEEEVLAVNDADGDGQRWKKEHFCELAMMKRRNGRK
jgi:hypothetical protein